MLDGVLPSLWTGSSGWSVRLTGVSALSLDIMSVGSSNAGQASSLDE